MMGLPKTDPRITVDEYLEMERAALERHVYLDGQVFAMAGESDEHSDISVNVIGLFYNQLRGKRCRPRGSNTKIRSGPAGPVSRRRMKGMFSYPDIVVICGEPEHHDEFKDIVINPTAIVEVLSKSTESFDRGEKFTRYQAWNPTLQDYVLISQDKPQIEHFHRLPDGAWKYKLYSGLKAAVKITSIQYTLKLAEVYERVKFPEEDTEK